MATLTLKCSSWDVGQLQITYTASNGTLKITEIKGRRTDSYRSYNLDKKSISIKVDGTSKSVSISHGIDFGAGSYVTWGATDTSWTGIYKTSVSISITMPSTSQAFGGKVFTGTATMSLSTYAVTYNANGGSGAPAKQTKTYGKALTLSSTKPTRSGYTFVGWGTSTTDTSSDYAAGASYTANKAITLYAIWKKIIKLTYNANGGSGAPAAQSKTVYNATTSYTFTLSSTKPTRTGYTFLGWSTSSTATSASYAAGGTITLSSDDILYAVWKINTYPVYYNANGGSGAPATQTKTYGTTLKLSTTKPTRTGYEFQGWGTSASATTVSYAAGASYTANASITLYAIWKLKTYTISYNANGGSGVPANQTKTHGVALTLSTTKPARSGYTFAGWSTSSSATSVSYVAGSSYTSNASVTLYAVWNVTDVYTISYNTLGGSEIVSQTKYSGVDIVLRNNIPIKNGYTFKGWSLSTDDISVDYNAGDTYTGNDNLVLYAIWEAWTHTVVFNTNGGAGDVPSSFVKTTDIDVIIPESSLEKDYCIFKCWNTTPDNSGGFDFYTGDGYDITQNGGTVTLYAIWEEKKILIFSTKKCEATTFIEDNKLIGFGNNGSVYATEFIEDDTLNLNSSHLHFGEIIER